VTSDLQPIPESQDSASLAVLRAEIADAQEELRHLRAREKGHSWHAAVTWMAGGIIVPTAAVYSIPLAIAILVLVIPLLVLRESWYARRLGDADALIDDLNRRLPPPSDRSDGDT